MDKLDFKNQLSELKYKPLYPALKNPNDEQGMDMSIAMMQQQQDFPRITQLTDCISDQEIGVKAI